MPDIEIRSTANVEVANHALEQWYREAIGVVALELEEDLKKVLEDIKENYVPIDTHALQESGRVDPVEIDAQGNITTGISFGNAEVNYAVYQHEDLTYNHKHGQAKYIEVPLSAYVERRGGGGG